MRASVALRIYMHRNDQVGFGKRAATLAKCSATAFDIDPASTGLSLATTNRFVPGDIGGLCISLGSRHRAKTRLAFGLHGDKGSENGLAPNSVEPHISYLPCFSVMLPSSGCCQ